MVRDRGFEPLTPSGSRKCSTTELTAPPMPEDRLGTLCFSWSFVEADGQETRSSQGSFQAEQPPSPLAPCRSGWPPPPPRSLEASYLPQPPRKVTWRLVRDPNSLGTPFTDFPLP